MRSLRFSFRLQMNSLEMRFIFLEIRLGDVGSEIATASLIMMDYNWWFDDKMSDCDTRSFIFQFEWKKSHLHFEHSIARIHRTKDFLIFKNFHFSTFKILKSICTCEKSIFTAPPTGNFFFNFANLKVSILMNLLKWKKVK